MSRPDTPAEGYRRVRVGVTAAVGGSGGSIRICPVRYYLRICTDTHIYIHIRLHITLTSASSDVESAFTTLTPTPCSPPDICTPPHNQYTHHSKYHAHTLLKGKRSHLIPAIIATELPSGVQHAEDGL